MKFSLVMIYNCQKKLELIMNKLKYLIAALIIPAVFSQDFDDSFLNSLPEDIQEDVLERVESNSDKEKPSFLKFDYIFRARKKRA